jgi:HSP20 family protein
MSDAPRSGPGQGPPPPGSRPGEGLFRLSEPFASLGGEAGESTWTPPVDILETDDAYLLRAALPGMTKEDIQITIEHNVVRLAGERKLEEPGEGESYHRIEGGYGSFKRSFALPKQVEVKEAKAQFEAGVLMVTIPKGKSGKPPKIRLDLSQGFSETYAPQGQGEFSMSAVIRTGQGLPHTVVPQDQTQASSDAVESMTEIEVQAEVQSWIESSIKRIEKALSYIQARAMAVEGKLGRLS